MNRQTIFSSWLSVLGFTLLLGCSTAFSQSGSWNPGEPVAENLAEHGEFIAAFDWSVERSRSFVWPFESMRPAPYESVWMVVEKMPRAWPEKRGDKASVPLSVYCCLQVNGRSLPKPQRVTDSQNEFRVSLEQGRLRFSFSLPSGFRLDSRYTLIRIKLYQVSKQHNRVSPACSIIHHACSPFVIKHLNRPLKLFVLFLRCLRHCGSKSLRLRDQTINRKPSVTLPLERLVTMVFQLLRAMRTRMKTAVEEKE
jgi:hypothetical protein